MKIHKVNKLLAVCIIALFAGSIVNITTNAEDLKTIFVKISFDEPIIEQLQIANMTLNEVSVPNLHKMEIYGKPSLPIKSINILLPPGGKVEEIYCYGNANEINGSFLIRPGGKVAIWGSEVDNEVYMDSSIYNSTKAYPEEIYRMTGIHKFRGFTILTLELYPVQYIPKERKLYWYDNISILIKARKGNVDELYRGLPQDIEEVKDIVVNPSMIYEYPIASSLAEPLATYSYVIITDSSLESAFQSLVDYKSHFISATIVNLTYIQANFAGADLQEKIRNFIKWAYLNWNTEYVLLGGDDEIIPHRGFWCSVYTTSGWVTDSDIPADLYYAALDGTWDDDGDGLYGEPDDNPDYYAEVYVGRAPVATITEATNFVNKVITFETADKPMAVQLHEARLKTGNNPDATAIPENCAQWVPPSYTIDKLYEEYGTVTPSDWISKFNAGRIIFQHAGHGSTYGYNINYEVGGSYSWSTSNAASLTNTFYPIHTSVACYSGAFDANDCLAEEYILNPNGGTIACMLNSRYGWFSSTDASAFSGEFVEMQFYELFQNGRENLGKMLQYAKEHFVSEATSYNVYRWCYYEINLLGDPETPALTKRTVTGPVYNIDKDTYYNTIQDAINDADNGNTIVVSNGIYNENVIVNKSVTIMGENKSTTIIDGGGVADAVAIVANNVVIKNFTIRNGGEEGIYIEGVANINISNCIIAFNGDCGILLNQSTNVSIFGNIIHNNSFDGILLYYSSGNKIIGNTVYWNGIGNNGEGILLMYSNGNYIAKNEVYENGETGIILEPNSSNNNVSSNTAYNNADCGILISTGSNGNMIYNNTAYGNTFDGILVESSQDNSIIGNVIYDNGEDGVSLLSSATNCTVKGNTVYSNNAGISLHSVWNHSIVGNHIYGNNREGIVLWDNSYNITVSGNNIHDNQWGIEVGLNCHDNKLLDNEVYSNNYGIEVDNSSYITIENNTVYANNDYGIELVNSTNNVVLENHVYNNANNGIDLWYNANNNIIHSNIIEQNGGWGIELGYSSNNLIYNNYFNNTNNAWDNGNNKWNVSKTAGSNIIGGAWLGGNYWSNYLGYDEDGDGLGNTMLPYNNNNNIANGGDMLPLVNANHAPVANFSWMPENPHENETISFYGDCHDIDNDITTYIWNFGDGNVSRAGKCISFDGIDDYVGCGNDPSLNITDAITIEAWIKTNAANGHRFIVTKWPGFSLESYRPWATNGRFVLYIDSAARVLNFNTNVSDGKWHHVIATYDSSTATMKVYIDGVLDNSKTLTGLTNYTISMSGANLYIGKLWGYYFNGSIDDVRIYNRALSADEVYQNYIGNVTLDGLVSWWKFDGNANDCIGGNDGIVYGCSYETYGEYAMEFDGIDDYVDCGNDPSLNITDAITIEAWIKTNAANGHRFIVTKWPGFSLESYRPWATNGRFVLYIDSAARVLNFNTNVSDGKWHHVIATYDSSTATMKVYIDGVLDNSKTLTGLTNYTISMSGANLYIGKLWGYYFNGSIDDVRIYNRALSADEVYQNYIGNVTTTGLVSWWKFDGNANDCIGGNDGIVHGGKWQVIAKHKYAKAGTYNVTLTVIDDDNAKASVTKEVVVASSANNPPIANFSYIPSSPTTQDTIRFIDSSYDTDGFIIDYIWNFGDGNISRAGKCISFDGIDDYVGCGNDPSLNITDAITIEAWIKTNAANGHRFIVTKWPGFSLESYRPWATNGRFVLYIDSAARVLNFNTNVSDGKWHHVIATYDSSTATMKVYIDGVLDNSKTLTGLTNYTISMSGANLYIGKLWGYYFNGSIDDVRIYNRALSADEVYQNYIGNVTTTGLVSWWKFDGNANDCIGNNDGIVYGCSYETYGEYAMEFDGIDDYVGCGNDPSLNITDAITIEAWIKTNAANGHRFIVTKWPGFSLESYRPWATNGRFVLYIDSAARVLNFNTNVSDGKWHHVIATYDSSTATMKVYIDGVLDNSKTLTGLTNYTISMSGANLYIGKLWGYYFNGSIDDVRIYNRALSADEVYQNYIGNVTTTGLVSWWKFDGNANDCIGNNDGIVHGCNWQVHAKHKYAKAGTYNVTLTVIDDDNAKASVTKEVVVSSGTVTASLLPIYVENSLSYDRTVPVTSGFPFPKGELPSINNIRLLDENLNEIPADFTALATWKDGSVKWVLVDFIADLPANGEKIYYIEYGDNVTQSSFSSPLTITENGNEIVVNTGKLRFTLNKTEFHFLEDVWLNVNGTWKKVADSGDIIVTNETGVKFYGTNVSIKVEKYGKVRSVIKIKGSHVNGSNSCLNFTMRIYVYANQSFLRIFYTEENDLAVLNNGAGQPDCFTFDSPNHITFEDISLVMYLNLSSLNYRVYGNGSTYSNAMSSTDDILIYQDSSGGDDWNRSDYWRHPTFRGYRIYVNNATIEQGNRAEAWIDLYDNEKGLAIAKRYFWQSYPSALEIEGNKVYARVMPCYYAIPFIHRVGEHKTHELFYFFHDNNTNLENEMASFYHPVMAWANASWYINSGVFDFASIYDPTNFSDYEANNLAAVNGSVASYTWQSNLFEIREYPDFYGWLHFGDVRVVDEDNGMGQSNLQYDFGYGMLFQAVRLARLNENWKKWFVLAEEANRHSADVDILHVHHGDPSQPSSYWIQWCWGGMFWHSEHGSNGSANPHRGSSPHPEFQFNRGLFYYYYLTGYEKALEAAMEIANNTRWRVMNGPGEPGYSATTSNEARAPAQILQILTDAYMHTWDKSYLEAINKTINESHFNTKWYKDGANASHASESVAPWQIGMLMDSLGRFITCYEQWYGKLHNEALSSLIGYANWLLNYTYINHSTASSNYPHFVYRWYGDGSYSDWHVNAWMLKISDGLMYAYFFTGNETYLKVAKESFINASRDFFFEGNPVGSFATEKLHAVLANSGKLYMYWVKNGRKLYVAPWGSDTNIGSISQPFKTIQHALDVANPKDEIIVRNGIYNESIYFNKTGNKNGFITLKAYKNEKVIINGNKQLAHGIIINKECKYIKIENISIRNFTAYGVVMLGNNSYVYLNGLEITSCDTAIRITEYAYSNVTASKIFIRNCYLCNNSLLGLDCAPGPVYDIYIYNTTSCNNGNGSNTAADGFAIEKGNNITFEKCIAMQNAGDGFDSKASNTTVILCISKGNERNGIKLWEKNCSIVGSLSCLNGLAGIVLTEGGSYWLIGNTVARNGFYGDYGMYVAYDAPLYTYVYMRNNIFAFNYGGVYFGESVDLNENYNLYYSREDGEITADFTSHIYYTRQEINNKLWYNDTGNGFNDMAYDPLFVSTDDFHLSNGSPAIDNGTNEGIAYDLDGNSRPYGSAYDIGAYEWQG